MSDRPPPPAGPVKSSVKGMVFSASLVPAGGVREGRSSRKTVCPGWITSANAGAGNAATPSRRAAADRRMRVAVLGMGVPPYVLTQGTGWRALLPDAGGFYSKKREPGYGQYGQVARWCGYSRIERQCSTDVSRMVNRPRLRGAY